MKHIKLKMLRTLKSSMTSAKITVEASLIIPLIISIICAMLYEALLSCDRGVINMTADRVMEEALANGGHVGEDAENTDNTKKAENTVEVSALIQEKLSKKIMLYSIEELTYENKNNEITLRVHAVPKITMGIAGVFRGAFGEYIINRSVKTRNICSAVRRMDIVKDDA